MNLRVTENDIKVLEGVYRFRFLELVQIMLLIGTTKEATAYTRVRRLKQLGMIGGKALLARGQAYHLTVEGMKLIRQEGREIKIGLGSYEHDIKTAQVLLEFLVQGKEIITERELRVEQRGIAGHWPDGVVLDGKKKIAIEVELSDKAAVRVAGIIDFYIKASYEQVWYFTDSKSVEVLLGRVIKQKGADDFIKVKPLG
ncbi:MAG: hypothetical protein HAW61_02595 [Candidatus Portiera sp.]|nr:hypothetical protein [Portiera sp.]